MAPSCKRPTSNVHVCLQCVYFGCSNIPSHLSRHYSSANHAVYLSVEHGRVYCVLCKDFVFHPMIDAAIELQRRIARDNRRRFFSSEKGTDNPYGVRDRVKKRRLMSWNPTNMEKGILAKNSNRVNSKYESAFSPIGLYNLGNSCYMNSVLYAILNAPALRNFFLADLHRPFCRANRRGCLACAIDDLITTTYDNRRINSTKSNSNNNTNSNTPFVVPQTVLEIIWKNADHLATYSQHDAHEFFISALNILNMHCNEAKPPSAIGEEAEPAESSDSTPPPFGNEGTDGIVKTLFSGTLQSDVICTVCGNSSPTLEKFYDVSLDVEPNESTNSNNNNNGLYECLARFTEPEALGCKLFCSICRKKEEATKAMSIKSIPAIVSFHFKRFEQSFVKVRRSDLVKIDTPVQFPVDALDLTQFRTGARGLTTNRTTNSQQLNPTQNEALYDLFAVVNHTGTIDTGHYTTLVRKDGDWFRCDDDKIQKVKSPGIIVSDGGAKVIKSKEAYLCFYAAREPNLAF